MSGSFIVAGTASSDGKTLITLGLLGAFKAQGLRVASAKAGPDYIDPTFHERITGKPTYNLDSWAFNRSTLVRLMEQASAQADLLIVEGVMGLFDGITGGTGSTAHLATTLGLPVVLVVDAGGTGQSLGATVRGFIVQAEKAGVQIAGIIANRIGSPRHLALLREGLEQAEVAEAKVPLLGAIPNDPLLQLPLRHLGLIPASEQTALDSAISRATELVAQNCDLATIENLAASVPPTVSLTVPDTVRESVPESTSTQSPLRGHEFHYATTVKEDTSNASPLFRISDAVGTDLGTSGLRKDSVCGSFVHLLTPFAPHELIGQEAEEQKIKSQAKPIQSTTIATIISIAKDQAFAFAYPHLLDYWHSNGAKIHFFSPLADEAPAPDADFIFLPGGYPELHAATLAKASRFKQALREAASRTNSKVLIYGECGGYMTLGESLTDAEGKKHPMVGLLPLETSFQHRKLHLGYRQLGVINA